MSRTSFILAAVLVFFVKMLSAQIKTPLFTDFSKISNSHDISLPSWGPYSKKYAGISHIYDINAGMRFDFSVLPGFYRNKILIPNVQFESGYFPWEANNDLSDYTYRYELEWKDRVFVDVTYSVIDSLTVLTAVKCKNNSTLPQNLSLNLVYGIEYPDIYPVNQLIHSANTVWINAADYKEIGFVKKQPKDNLVTDGWMLGEIRDNAFFGGAAVGRNFGRDKGDKISFTITLKQSYKEGLLTLFYRMKEGAASTFHLSGLADSTVTLSGSGRLDTINIPFEFSNKDEQVLVLESGGGDEVELNGILYGPAAEAAQTKIVEQSRQYAPESSNDAAGQKTVSKYADIPFYYGFGWDGNNDFRFRQIQNDELDVFFRRLVHSHVDSILKGNKKGDYSNIFIRPVTLLPQSEKTIFGIICTGSRQQVSERLRDVTYLIEKYGNAKKQKIAAVNNILPQGNKYLFSQKMLQATLLSNVVYPIYTQRNYIRHFTPGKWWNSLYTWDLGFIALGLNEININAAAACINAYTTPVGSQSAFIHHGSPVPTQFYAFLDLWNKTQSKEALHYFYPRLKQYYAFMSGRSGSSTLRKLGSNLLKPWDYWYNSGGWDDYPAQVEVHRKNAEAVVAPVINTAQQIRIAKIMRMAAEVMEKKDDILMYDKDINEFSMALQKYSWNEKSGYFSYVVHDTAGNPVGKFLNADGVDFNMGLDGAYPLVSGICTAAQKEHLLKKIFSEKHMWTPSGICAVDQSAPYYKTDGYWNGSVWMPHQWFLWKTMLDIGRGDLAFKIAKEGMEVYSRETNESYYTFEHFLAKSGRGAGWHQFSGLSTPVLSWFAAYYKPGSVTAGFEIWIQEQLFNISNSAYRATLSFDRATVPHQRTLLVCLNPSFTYKVTFNNKRVETISPHRGLLQINLPASDEEGVLEVVPVEN